jgi:hypothetical protein
LWERRNAYKMLVGRERLLESSRYRWGLQYSIKMSVKEIGWEGGD